MSTSKNNLHIDPSEFLKDEFFHTMKDNLNPVSQIKKMDSPEQKNSSFFSQTTPSAPSPFLSETSAPQESVAVKKNIYQEKPVLKSSLSNDIDDIYSDKSVEEFHELEERSAKKSLLKKILLTIFFILLLAAAGVAGYFYWKNTLQKKPSTASIIQSEQELVKDAPRKESQITISPLSEKYFKEKPNDIKISVEETDSSGIKKILSETATEVGTIQADVPVEFILKDSNGTPIAFPIFAIKSDIQLSPELLKNLEESFSFFVYNDKENVRTGLSIDVKDEKNVLLEMSKDEQGLIKALSFLFLDRDLSENPISFTENSYSGVESRYFNLDTENTISIDYGVYENKLIVGTSKNTFRAIIDKIISQKIK